MIETQGRIVALRGGIADVRLAVASACSACGHKGTCDNGRERTVSVAAPLGAHAGDSVTLALSESALHLGGLLGYLLPALTTLGGAIALAPAGDASAALGAALGLAGGLLCVRFLSRRWNAAGGLPVACTTENQP